MEETKKTATTPVVLKRSRLGPSFKASVKPRLSGTVPNGNGLNNKSDDNSDKTPEVPSDVEQEEASMSVRNKEICRLHMEETNSINNVQNSDSKSNTNEIGNATDSPKDAGDVSVKKESIPLPVDETKPVANADDSNSITDKSNHSDESDKKDIVKVEKSDVVNNSSTDELDKTGEKNDDNLPIADKNEVSNNKVVSSSESVKANGASKDSPKVDDKPAEVGSETEIGSKTEIESKTKVGSKTEVVSKAEVVSKTKVGSKTEVNSKEASKKPGTKKHQEDEALSSESEEFHGFDNEHTEKSIKAKKDFIENSEDSEVTSSAVPKTPASEDVNSKVSSANLNKRMRKNIVDLTNPMYRKPFDFGWKRELVYRTTSDSDNKRQGDIYYYTPRGKKVRSAREVQEHITDPELSVDNFTFFKEPLGINDPSKEIIRDAKIRLSKDFALLTPPPKAVSRTPKAKATVTPVTPVTSSKSTPKVVIKTPSTPSSGGLKVKFTGIKSGPASTKSSIQKSKPAKVKKRKSSSGGSSELEMGMLPPMWNSPEVKSDSLTSARSWSPPTVSESTKAEVDRSCSIYCPLAMGVVPSLQCHVCQCLYHPECCGISPVRTILQYVCKKCQKNWNWKTRTVSSTTKSGNSMTVSLPPPSPNLVSISNPLSTKIPATSTIIKTTKTNKLTNIVGGVTTWLPPSSTIQFSSNNATLNPQITSSTVARTTPDSQSATPPSQTVIDINGKRFIVMPKTNVVSVSSPSQPGPTATNVSGFTNPPVPVPVTAIQCFPRPQLVNAESLALTPLSASNFIAGGSILPNSTPGTFLMSTETTNPPGVLLVPCLPQQTQLGDTIAVQPQYVLVNSSGVGGNLMFANTLVQSSEDKESYPNDQTVRNVGKKRSAEKHSDDKKSPPAKKIKVENDVEQPAQSVVAGQSLVTTTTPNSVSAQQNPSHYFMMNLAAGYSTLMHIFRYLNLKELLIASRVCRLWHDVASKPHFWQTVRMKNTQVSDWNGFANALIKHDTRHLDLRKMLVGSKPEEVKNNWLEFYNVIGRVQSLKRIELCRCLSSVIENLAKHVPHLESLTATSIKNPSLNLESLGVMTNLTELRLKGMSGLELTFNHLSNFKELKLLSITGIKNLNDESSMTIGSLEKLETLEIGDCNNIFEKTVTESIPKLSNLKRLRFEKGQNSVPLIIQLLESASKLPQLEILELINFDVKPGFENALGKCTNIKSLLMIPTYITQSATTNHIVMMGVSKLKGTLKQFVWGLTLELLRVTDLFIDQCESSKNSPAQSPNSNGNNKGKGKGDSIPILKPLIDTLEEGHDIKEQIPLTSSGPSKVDILPIPKLRKVLSNVLPSTDIKILKIPFSSTWRQTLIY